MKSSTLVVAFLPLLFILAGCGKSALPEDPGLPEGRDMRDTFREAVINSDEATVVDLLNQQPLLAKAKHPTSGQLPLHLAVRAGNEAIIKLLLENGANPAALNDEGESALDAAHSSGAGESILALLQ